MKRKNIILLIFSILILYSYTNSFLQTIQSSPSKLMVELMEFPEKTNISDFNPEFGWVMNSNIKNDVQTAYQIIVAISAENLKQNIGDMWDSGKINSNK